MNKKSNLTSMQFIEQKFQRRIISITGDQITAGEFLIRLALKTEGKVLLFDPENIYSETHVRAQNPSLAKKTSKLTVARPLKGGSILPLLLATKPKLVLASSASQAQLQELRAYARLHGATAFILGPGGDVEYEV